ncbi:Vesicle-associated protein 1-3 [Astathelohania contejeani]|uniref:Vesicle-associated protein 1-3 n=1 Tax=Astathelohania contejeani TaxID=164912 RepID=A0ABQ7HWF8_9MICR|nr:Vesicle-associated protein 1-3 [Thelohania contejeani]
MEEVEIKPHQKVILDTLNRCATITIKNKVSIGKAYKIKTTNPHDYSVKPNSGMLMPGQEASINIVMEKDIPVRGEHKFLIEIYNFDWKKQPDDLRLFFKNPENSPVLVRKLGVERATEVKILGFGEDKSQLELIDIFSVAIICIEFLFVCARLFK